MEDLKTYPWRIIIKNVEGTSPKLIIQNELSNKHIRSEEIRKRVEYLITKSGRTFVSVNFGILLSTTTDEYYLGVILDQPYIPSVDSINLDNVIIDRESWLQKNVHVVLAYVGKEIECVLRNQNITDCHDLYAVLRVERFSLRIRTNPKVTPCVNCGIYVGTDKPMCFDC